MYILMVSEDTFPVHLKHSFAGVMKCEDCDSESACSSPCHTSPSTTPIRYQSFPDNHTNSHPNDDSTPAQSCQTTHTCASDRSEPPACSTRCPAETSARLPPLAAFFHSASIGRRFLAHSAYAAASYHVTFTIGWSSIQPPGGSSNIFRPVIMQNSR